MHAVATTSLFDVLTEYWGTKWVQKVPSQKSWIASLLLDYKNSQQIIWNPHTDTAQHLHTSHISPKAEGKIP